MRDDKTEISKNKNFSTKLDFDLVHNYQKMSYLKLIFMNNTLFSV